MKASWTHHAMIESTMSFFCVYDAQMYHGQVNNIKKNEKPNIEEIWRNFSKTFSLADTINFRRRRIFTKKKRGIIKRKESLFLLLPFMTRNIDADFSWGSLNIGLDDGGEILEDEPERIAGNSNVPATFKNRSNLI